MRVAGKLGFWVAMDWKSREDDLVIVPPLLSEDEEDDDDDNEMNEIPLLQLQTPIFLSLSFLVLVLIG